MVSEVSATHCNEEKDFSSRSPNKQAVSRPPRHTSSKYDFVKVRVWLGENSDHYYVLSRFLVSRMLTVTKIPSHVAIKIALELKKLLIDNSLLDVSQADLEANLFKLMERRGFGLEYINLYKMMTRFHHQRIPLIILVCGAACVGKSTIATQLAQRLNLPNVLQTDMVYELLRTAPDPPLCSTPIWAREFSSPEELVTEFCRECRIVRKGLDGDLRKAMKEGKPIIIEGVHLDPSIYLMDEDNGTMTSQDETNLVPIKPILSPLRMRSESEPRMIEHPLSPHYCESGTSHALKALVEGGNRKHLSKKGKAIRDEDGKNGLVDCGGGADLSRSQPHSCNGQTSEDKAPSSLEGMARDRVTLALTDEAGNQSSVRPPAKAIVVPIVLRMADIDHQTLLEEWIAFRSTEGTATLEGKNALVNKLQTIQDYLCSFESQGMKVVNISATTFPQTLDWLHSYLLQCIELGCAIRNTRSGS